MLHTRAELEVKWGENTKEAPTNCLEEGGTACRRSPLSAGSSVRVSEFAKERKQNIKGGKMRLFLRILYYVLPGFSITTRKSKSCFPELRPSLPPAPNQNPSSASHYTFSDLHS